MRAPTWRDVAVIGAGATGSFFSHFVANVTRGLGVSIDVYEASDRIGGRAASSNDTERCRIRRSMIIAELMFRRGVEWFDAHSQAVS